MGATRIHRLTSKRVVTIANGASLSDAVDLDGYVISAIEMPGGWTTAAITFQASTDGTNFKDVYGDDGIEVSIASANVVASRFIVNKAVLEQLAGARHIKIRSGTSATPVNQGAARVLTLIFKG